MTLRIQLCVPPVASFFLLLVSFLSHTTRLAGALLQRSQTLPSFGRELELRGKIAIRRPLNTGWWIDRSEIACVKHSIDSS